MLLFKFETLLQLRHPYCLLLFSLSYEVEDFIFITKLCNIEVAMGIISSDNASIIINMYTWKKCSWSASIPQCLKDCSLNTSGATSLTNLIRPIGKMLFSFYFSWMHACMSYTGHSMENGCTKSTNLKYFVSFLLIHKSSVFQDTKSLLKLQFHPVSTLLFEGPTSLSLEKHSFMIE